MEGPSDWRAVAVANIRSARSNNRRLGSRKTRSGCITCRQRHLKCDEGKPSCKRCQDSHKVCAGYSTSPSPAPSINAPLPGQLAFPLTAIETQSLDFFLNHISSRLSGPACHTQFWHQLIQLCHQESFVLDAILSFSTLTRYPQFLDHFSTDHNDLDSKADKLSRLKAGDPFANAVLNKDVTVALVHLNRSIASLSQRLRQDLESQIYAALSCLLYMAIEMSRDHVFEALRLYLQGRKIIASSLEQLQQHSLGQATVTEFRRLDLFVPCVDIPPLPGDVGTTIITEPFGSFEIARTSLATIIYDSQQYVKDAACHIASVHHIRPMPRQELLPATAIEAGIAPSATAPSAQSDDVGMLIRQFVGHDPALHVVRIDPMDFGWNRDFYKGAIEFAAQSSTDLIAIERQFANRLGQWYDASINLTTSNEDVNQASQLLMYYFVSMIWLSTRLAADQTVFDKYDHLFREILRHARAYIGTSGEQQIGFTLKLGAVAPLYFVATKCRVPSLRRQALFLLTKTPRKECMFGATGCAEIAAALVKFEEEGLDLQDPRQLSDKPWAVDIDRTLPSEARRCHHFQVLQDDELMRYSLLLSCYVPLLDGTRVQFDNVVDILPLHPAHDSSGQHISASD